MCRRTVSIFIDTYRMCRQCNILFLFVYILSFNRLHNYSTRSDSLDLHVVDIPKLICTSYQLQEQMNRIREEQQQQQFATALSPNGDVLNLSSNKQDADQQQMIQVRIDELEQELDRLRLQLTKIEPS
jgi:hypothetical protein